MCRGLGGSGEGVWGKFGGRGGWALWGLVWGESLSLLLWWLGGLRAAGELGRLSAWDVGGWWWCDACSLDGALGWFGLVAADFVLAGLVGRGLLGCAAVFV